PLCPVELQDPLRAVYSSRSEKSSIETLTAIRLLFEGVPYVHLKTIQVLFGVLSEQIKGDENSAAREQFVKAVSQRLGPIILRGREIVGVGVGRLPETLVTDLIEHYDVVLAGIETRRPIKPCARPIKSESAVDAGPSSRRAEEDPEATSRALLETAAAAAAEAVVATKRSSAVSSHSAADQAVGKRASVGSTSGGGGQSAMSNSAGTQRSHASLDEDELLVDDILEEARDSNGGDGGGGGGGGEDNMDFFLKDEDSDGTDDEDDDEE
ncbi:hypothetical protein GGF44_003472, partial [Coemansia sp. RSA 1694]